MALTADSLELALPNAGCSLSASRLWEHCEYDQVNVFGRELSGELCVDAPADFIDVLQSDPGGCILIVGTLAEVTDGRPTPDRVGRALAAGRAWNAEGDDVENFKARVAEYLGQRSKRKAVRNMPRPFLPAPRPDDRFGVPGLFSLLQRRLQGLGKAKSTADQWKNTVQNLQKKGLRAEEVERSGVLASLGAHGPAGQQYTGHDVAVMCSFDALRLSVIPVLTDATRQLRFGPVSGRTLVATKSLPKAQHGQQRMVTQVDPALGYRIEQVVHQSLWGTERHWQAVTGDGRLLRPDMGQPLLESAESAEQLATGHAAVHFPKKLTLGRWGRFAWSGGENYKEWLITLPFYPTSYFSSHFPLRNVLAHVRCDVREGADGERVLLLHEVQSDWAQDARRAIGSGDMEPCDPACPPFVKEWPALVMKLVLLHAVHERLDAVAWTRGTHQAQRYRGLGAVGLAELYDRTLPRDVNRILRPLGAACEMLGVFVPTNFRVRQAESGYEVYSAENELLGTAPTLEDAQDFLPDGAHEQLYDVHAVRLPAELRDAILQSGFPAWG